MKWFAHAVAQATDVTEMIRQHVAQSGSECHIVGEMKCFADTSLRRSEFFIDSKKDENTVDGLHQNEIYKY